MRSAHACTLSAVVLHTSVIGTSDCSPRGVTATQPFWTAQESVPSPESLQGIMYIIGSCNLCALQLLINLIGKIALQLLPDVQEAV